MYMELTRKQTIESLKEVKHFLKMLDHFKYLRDVVDVADSMIDDQTHLVKEASKIRERAHADAKGVVDAAREWYEDQMKEWGPLVVNIKQEYENHQVKCDESRDELVVIREAVKIEQAALAADQMTHKAEQITHNKEVVKLQAHITDLKKTAAEMAARFKF